MSAPPRSARRPVILPDYVELELRISPDARCPAVVQARKQRALLGHRRAGYACLRMSAAAQLVSGRTLPCCGPHMPWQQRVPSSAAAARRVPGPICRSRTTASAPTLLRSAVLQFDGRDGRELQQGDSIRVRMSPNPVPTINNADQVGAGLGCSDCTTHYCPPFAPARLLPSRYCCR